MKKSGKTFIVITSLLASCIVAVFITCSAEANKIVSSPEEDIENFFRIYSENTDKAVTTLFMSNKNIDIKGDAGMELVSKLKGIVQKLGNYNGYELIVKRKAGESMVLYSYLVKYDSQPLRFNFMYYKPKDSWKIYDFEFDTDVDDELKRAADIYLIEETYIGKSSK